MQKKKKMIIIIVAIVVVALIVLGVILANKSNKVTSNTKAETKVSTLYNKIKNTDTYSFNFTADDNSKVFYAKSGEKAYMDTKYNGSETKYIIKDGNSYLIKDSDKRYYTYTNNNIDLDLVSNILADLINLEHNDGKEEIDGKSYNYEEYSVLTNIAISDFSNETNIKTRLYFKGKDLVYIKTISDRKQELLKVDMSTKVENNLFEIPSDYVEG